MTAPEKKCPFCNLAPGRILAEGPLALAVRDGYPLEPRTRADRSAAARRVVVRRDRSRARRDVAPRRRRATDRRRAARPRCVRSRHRRRSCGGADRSASASPPDPAIRGRRRGPAGRRALDHSGTRSVLGRAMTSIPADADRLDFPRCSSAHVCPDRFPSALVGHRNTPTGSTYPPLRPFLELASQGVRMVESRCNAPAYSDERSRQFRR